MKSRFQMLIAGFALAVFVGAIGLRSCATAKGIPLFGTDSCVFLPQTVPFYERGELINEVWRPARHIDPLGKGRMVYHGFLYPMILTLLMWRGDYLAMVGSLAILHAVSALLLCGLLWNFAKCWKWRMTPGQLLLVPLLGWAGANYTQGGLGRPEPLAAIIVMGSALVMSRSHLRWHGCIAGIGIGLATASDPIVGVFGGLAFAAYAGWRFPARRCLLEIAGAAVVSMLALACCFLWYPYSVGEWFRGTSGMGQGALAVGERGHYWQNFLVECFSYGSSWFLPGTVLLVVWSGVRLVRRQRRAGQGPCSPLVFYASLLLTGAAALRFVLYLPWARYNVLPFVPLGFLLIFHELGQESPRGRPSPYRFAAVIVLAIASLGLPTDLFQRYHTLRFGLDLRAARSLFNAVRKNHPDEVIAMNQSLFTLTEDYRNIVFWKNEAPPAEATILLDSQFSQRQLRPVAIDGFRLAADHFNSRPPSLLGVTVPLRDRGCGFAVYLRDGAEVRTVIPNHEDLPGAGRAIGTSDGAQ